MPSVTAPATPIYNVVGNGNFQYDASAPGGLAFWTALGTAHLVSGNAYHGDGNIGNYAVQLISSGASSGRRRVRRQTSNGGAAGIEQILSDLDQTSQYTVSSRHGEIFLHGLSTYICIGLALVLYRLY